MMAPPRQADKFTELENQACIDARIALSGTELDIGWAAVLHSA